MMQTEFDPVKHEYFLNARRVPHVTGIINSIIPMWRVDPWYMGRGRANHEGYAHIALGKDKDFDYAPECLPFMNGCRKFFEEVKPVVHSVELPVFSERYQYAGMLDLFARIDKDLIIIDYKGSMTDALQYQLGAYSIALTEKYPTIRAHYGLGVVIKDDGTYHMTERINLKRAGNGFLAMRTVYGIINK